MQMRTLICLKAEQMCQSISCIEVTPDKVYQDMNSYYLGEEHEDVQTDMKSYNYFNTPFKNIIPESKISSNVDSERNGIKFP